MKKLILLFMILAMIATLFFGCTPSSGDGPEPSPDDAGNEPSSDNQAPDGDDVITGGTAYTGKVTGIVGNEIEVDLASFPEMNPGGEEGTGSGSYSAPSFSVEVSEDEGVLVGQEDDAAGENGGDGSVPYISYFAEGADGDAVLISPDALSGEDMGLDFTGEHKSFVVPAGAKITNFNGEGKLENITKGSVVTFIVDENDVVTEVIIMG